LHFCTAATNINAVALKEASTAQVRDSEGFAIDVLNLLADSLEKAPSLWITFNRCLR
jgi:hypothetical protein